MLYTPAFEHGCVTSANLFLWLNPAKRLNRLLWICRRNKPRAALWQRGFLNWLRTLLDCW